MDGTVESKLLLYKANFYRTRTARIIATSEDSQRGRCGVWGVFMWFGQGSWGVKDPDGPLGGWVGRPRPSGGLVGQWESTGSLMRVGTRDWVRPVLLERQKERGLRETILLESWLEISRLHGTPFSPPLASADIFSKK